MQECTNQNPSDFELGNPPVVEVAIVSHYLPSESPGKWDKPIIDSFFEEIVDTGYEPTNIGIRQAFQVKYKDPEHRAPEQLRIDRRIDSVLAQKKDTCLSLQLGQDWFSVNLLRQGIDYPGFASILEEWSGLHDRYIAFFRPQKVSRLILRYNDAVKIPLLQGKTILEDYFTVRPALPEQSFGDIGDFQLQFVISGAAPDHALIVNFGSVRSRESEHANFRILWHYVIEKTKDPLDLDKNGLKTLLGEARIKMRECFRSFFADKGWQLFDPR